MKCYLGLPEENLSFLSARLEAEDGILEGRKHSFHHVEPKMEVDPVEDRTQKRKKIVFQWYYLSSESSCAWSWTHPLGLSALRANKFLLCLSHFELGFLSPATVTPGEETASLQTVQLAFLLCTSVFQPGSCEFALKNWWFWMHWKGLYSELEWWRT